MARPTIVEQEQRKNLISDLMLRGVSGITQIRDELAIAGILGDQADESARKLIQKDIYEIRLEWQQTRVANVEEALGRELAKIEKIESEAWREYERSKTDSVKRVHKTLTSAAGGISYEEVEETSDRIGSAKLLDRIAWCIEKRIRLLGLGDLGSVKANLTLRDEVDVGKMADEELKRKLDRLLGAE